VIVCADAVTVQYSRFTRVLLVAVVDTTSYIEFNPEPSSLSLLMTVVPEI
jgi:hypothetical protein